MQLNRNEIEIKKFSAGESSINISKIHCEDTNIIHFENTDNIFDLCLVVDALKRSDKWKYTILEIPYLPYSRQDRVCNVGEAFSLDVFAGIVNKLGFHKVVTWDVHSEIATSLFDNFVNREMYLCVSDTLIEGCSNIDLVDVIVAPDKGAKHKVKKIIEDGIVNAKFFIADKVRAKNNSSVNTNIDDKFKKYLRENKDIKIGVFDDICDGGRTFIELAKVILKENEGVELYLYTTHGIYSHGKEELKKYYKKVVCTNQLNKN